MDPNPASLVEAMVREASATRRNNLRVGAAFLTLGLGAGAGFLLLADRLQVQLYAVFFGFPLAAVGVLFLLKGTLTHPLQQLAERPAAPPPAKQIATLRQALPILLIGFPILTIWTAYDLLALESGELASVSVWAVVALAYDTLGFWPAVLVWPVLGATITIASWIKLQRLRAQVAPADPAQPR